MDKGGQDWNKGKKDVDNMNLNIHDWDVVWVWGAGGRRSCDFSLTLSEFVFFRRFVAG